MLFKPKKHIISKNAIVPYCAKDMFNLVNDIKQYPSFLNWCSSSSILSQTDDQIVASLSINKGLFTERFTTCNRLSSNEQSFDIYMTLKNGPFKQLGGHWHFNIINNEACKIVFDIEFSFANKLLDMTIAPIFSQIANTQLDAFVLRAKNIYQ